MAVLEYHEILPYVTDLADHPKSGSFGTLAVVIKFYRVGLDETLYKPVFNADEVAFWNNYYNEGGFRTYFIPNERPEETFLPFEEPELPEWPSEETENEDWYKRPQGPYVVGGKDA